MQNRSPLFFGAIGIAAVLALVVVVLFVKDTMYFVKLQRLDGSTSTTTGTLLIPEGYTTDVTRKDIRELNYIFDLGDQRYNGSALDDGQSTNQIAVRYLPDDPSVNLPAKLDIASEKAFTLLRLVAMLGFLGIGAAVVLLMRRAARHSAPPTQYPPRVL